MRNPRHEFPAWGAAAFALLAGCSGGASQVPPVAPLSGVPAQAAMAIRSHGGFVSALAPQLRRLPSASVARPPSFNNSAGQRTAYVSDAIAGFIDVFAQDGSLTARITSGLSGPQGIAVDGSGNLWVANSGGNDILFYPKGAMTPARTIPDPSGEPADVTVAADGTLFVSNIVGPTGPNIAVYPPGSTTAARYLADPGTGLYGGNFFVTVDKDGNVFSTILDWAQNGRVDEYVKGKQSGFKRLPIYGLAFPGGIKTYNGNLLVSDQLKSIVTEYTEGGKATGTVLFTGGNWIDIAPSKNGDVLFAAQTSQYPITYYNGASRYFPSGVFQRFFNDSAFQQPLGAALDPAL